MPETVVDLGQKVKAKYPGQYDDLSDIEVGQKVKAKFPGQYDDFVDNPNAAILAAQKAKFPTVAEQGGKPGSITPAVNGFMPDSNTPWNILKGIGRGVANVIGAPGAAIAGAGIAPGLAAMEQFGKAKIAPTTSEAVGHTLAGALPLVGPWAAEMGERAGSGDIAGTAAELGTTFGLPHALPVAAQVATEKLPDKLMANAANMRAPLPKANLRTLTGDLAATAIGYGVGGAPGAAVAESLNLIRKSPMFRNASAAVQEAAARFLVKGQMAPPLANAAESASPVPQVPMANPPMMREVSPLDIETKPPAGPSKEIPFTPAESTAAKPVTVRDMTTAEQAIRPVGRGQRSTMFNVPKLLDEVPELVGIRKGRKFDAILTDAFNAREEGVIQAEAAIPRETTVPNPKEALAEIKSEYDADPHMQATANKLGRLIEQWEALPDQVTWEQFRDAKRSFFEENSTRSAPMRRAYGALMESAKGISPELDAANKSYSIVRRAMDDANMETAAGVHRGTRIKDIGKAAKETFLEKSQPTPVAESAKQSMTERTVATEPTPAVDLPAMSRTIEDLHQHPARATPDSPQAKSFLFDLRNAARRYDPETVPFVDRAENALKGGNTSLYTQQSEVALMRLHSVEAAAKEAAKPGAPPQSAPISGGQLKAVGGAIAEEGRRTASATAQDRLAQSIDARLQQFRYIVRSGVTETTGKALGKAGPEAGSTNFDTESVRRGGGIMNAFPDLEKLGVSPGRIADAIERKAKDPFASNVLYDRARKLVADDMQGQLEWRPESGPESLSVRAKRVFDLRRRYSSPEPPF